MDVVSVQGRIGVANIKSSEVDGVEIVVDEAGIVPSKILAPQRRVVRPVVIFREMQLSQACPSDRSPHLARLP